MRIQSIKALQLTLAIAFSALCARADTLYVWGYDGKIVKLQDGVASVFPTNLSGANGPVGLAVDKQGRLHAAWPAGSYIYRFDTNGNANLAGAPDSVSGLMFDGYDNLYATAPNWMMIGLMVHRSDNGWDEYHNYSNGTESHLTYPLNLAMDKAGNLYAANADWSVLSSGFPPHVPTNTVEVYSGDFTWLRTVATNLHVPWGLAFDQAGNLFVSCSATNQILRFTPSGGSSVFADASRGLSTPHGLAFDSAGKLYVANAGNGTIEMFTPDGAGSIVLSNLVYPSSIAFYPGLRLAMSPIVLKNPIMNGGAFRFIFSNTPGATFTALATTSAPSSTGEWTPVGDISETSPGLFEFTDAQAASYARRLYRVRSP